MHVFSVVGIKQAFVLIFPIKYPLYFLFDAGPALSVIRRVFFTLVIEHAFSTLAVVGQSSC